MKPGISRIAQERAEQINKHGFTLEDDLRRYGPGDLTQLARFCLMTDEDAERDEFEKYLCSDSHGPNFDQRYIDKIKTKTVEERLVIAGALIAAELDSRSPEPIIDDEPLAKNIVAYYEKYREHCENNHLDDDSGSLTVSELINFVETEILPDEDDEDNDD